MTRATKRGNTDSGTQHLFREREAEPANKPLAERCRPVRLADVVGHDKIIGPKASLFQLLKSGHLPSIIFWGPPGVGKTTIARLLAKEVDYLFQSVSAVSSGVKQVKEIIAAAGQQLDFYGRKSVLFIDEIHRFNKAQQDALLQAVENGTIVLIGATTENPSFEVNAPLLSRCRVITLQALSAADLRKIIERAVQNDVLLKKFGFELKDMDSLIRLGGGDARRTLNLLEAAFQLADKSRREIILDKALIKRAAAQNVAYYDKKGAYHYDTISAFIKSVRGSDPDAAVYWLAVMLNGGEDPLFIARRMIILASEDIGNAEPYALSLANAGFEAVHHIGMPEARIILSQVATYLASVPKSNAAYLAIDEALEEVRKQRAHSVPLHLRNAPAKLMKEIGYGQDYKYPHQYPGHYVRQQYLPDHLNGTVFYRPTEMGREAKLKSYLEKKRNNEKRTK